MIRSKVFQLAAVAALMVGAQSASACSLAAWTGAVSTATTGEPTAGFSRYSGRCSMRSSAAAQFVTDNTPTAETTFKARFYFYTGGLAGGPAVIYQAQNAGGTNIIQVSYDGSLATPQLTFSVNGAATTQTANVAANRYYSIEVRWAAAGTFTALVKGGGLPAVTTVNISGFTGGVIDTARLGWISGGSLPGGTTTPFFDEYDSRRTSDIGNLCRGDANNDGVYGSADRVLMTNEILGTSLATGQPDMNEDGAIGSGDRVLVTNAILAATPCPN